MIDLIEGYSNVLNFMGSEYILNLAYDNVLIVMKALEEEGLEVIDKMEICLSRIVGELPNDLEKAVDLYNIVVKDYLLCGEEHKIPVDIAGNPMPAIKKQAYYSFIYDADLIYAGFMQTYGIDLLEKRGIMPWIVFRALLSGLPSDTKFAEVIDIRKRPLPKGKGNAKAREELIKAKRELSFPGSDFAK